MRMPQRALVLLALAGPAALAAGPTPTTAALRDILIEGHTPITLEAATVDRGCGPAGCTIDADGVSILRDRGVLKQTGGKAIPVRLLSPGEAPALDWEPLDVFRVFGEGGYWGTCLEFSHAGIGKSGTMQRWVSVVLVPHHPPQRRIRAWRIVGYQTGCDALVALPGKPDTLSLPVIEATAKDRKTPFGLHLVWHHCDARKCTTAIDPRPVGGDPHGASGGLTIGTPSIRPAP